MEKLAILDCGGQYTKVIDRKIRELGVKSEIFPIDINADQLSGYKAIVLSGGPNSVWSDKAIYADSKIFELNIPILGICYGMQIICQFFGGTVSPNLKKEYGESRIEIELDTPIFSNITYNKQDVLMSHGDTVEAIPSGFKIIARSNDIIAGICNEEKKIYGLQFHPEVDLTKEGKTILNNFLRNISGFKEKFNLSDRIETSIKYIKNKVQDKKVIVLVSGGVDSAVSTALLLRALNKENVYAIHIDTGLMRKNESDIICKNLMKLGIKHLYRENAMDTFLNHKLVIENGELGPLTSLIDPEDKRKLIGELFIHVVKKVSFELNLDMNETFIAQGTLRPDLIESGNPDVSSFSNKIKTHHNDVDIIRQARKRGLIVETNWDWHKDEVRQVARLLGIEENIAARQPFPGPGLAVRIMCHDKDSYIEPKDIDKLEETMQNNTIKATIIPIKSVGVQGDFRSYKNLCLLESIKFSIEWNEICKKAKEITDNIGNINRVACILNKNRSKDKIITHRTTINVDNINLIREIDAIVTERLSKYKISQTFAVLIPIGVTKQYSVAIRTFITNDFMTGRPAILGKEIPFDVINTLVEDIMLSFGDMIEFVVFDVTGKPPATCEWL